VVHPVAKQRKPTPGQKQKETVIKLTEKQGIFVNCTADEVLYGGAAGG
jgi:hypothetical protein